MKIFISLLVVIVLAGVVSDAKAGRFFAELGIGLMHRKSGLPEVDLQNPLGRFAVGFRNRGGYEIKFEHITSVPQQESGYGINAVWLNRRIYF